MSFRQTMAELNRLAALWEDWNRTFVRPLSFANFVKMYNDLGTYVELQIANAYNEEEECKSRSFVEDEFLVVVRVCLDFTDVGRDGMYVDTLNYAAHDIAYCDLKKYLSVVERVRTLFETDYERNAHFGLQILAEVFRDVSVLSANSLDEHYTDILHNASVYLLCEAEDRQRMSERATCAHGRCVGFEDGEACDANDYEDYLHSSEWLDKSSDKPRCGDCGHCWKCEGHDWSD